MIPDSESNIAANLLMEFAERTGLTSDRPPRRYLWTDAFAVCSFLGLARQSAQEAWKWNDLASRLVEQVHRVLGHHRPDNSRTGWISGLGEYEGALHPTRGGLRIGKPLPELPPGVPGDARSEWDRDGQYFHYLTRWMQALDEMSHATNDRRYHRWARELAAAAHQAFIVRSAGRATHMYWKMSVDLTRPLVLSMGHHDPLDGLITYEELGEPAADEPDLRDAICEFAQLCEGRRWATDDPLGLGGILSESARLCRLIADRGLERMELLDELLDAGLLGLGAYEAADPLSQPAVYRLPFRELGLSIGLHAIANLPEWSHEIPIHLLTSEHDLNARIRMLKEHAPLADRIEKFWLEPANRVVESWTSHEDINSVMLSAGLLSRQAAFTRPIGLRA